MKIRAKKRFGQHFLTDEAVARRVADSLLPLPAFNRVLEIGPGQGMLTAPLLERYGARLRAAEVDRELAELLRKKFPGLQIDEGDFLKMDLTKIEAPLAVIGNFPYNISSQILFKVLEHKDRVVQLAGMFQREVARRIVSGPGTKDYGILSVLTQAFYEGEYLFDVGRSQFNPPPKVESGVIRLKRKENLSLDCDEAFFVKVVKAAFNQRRKMMSNSLKEWMDAAPAAREAYGKLRPEQLSWEQFVTLTRQLAAHE